MGRGQARTDSAPAAVETVLLTLADLPLLRLDDRVRLTERDAEALLRAYPDRSMWIPTTGEYAFVAPWRHRPELPVIQALSAFRHEPALFQALIAHMEAIGSAALILLDAEETRRAAFYSRYGLQVLERIQTYELRTPARYLDANGQLRLSFVPVDASDVAQLAALIALDHEVFPWLWWNSEPEFRDYLATPEVEVWAGMDGPKLVSYIGVTHFPGWGHLDRIAVARAEQGAGFGRESLRFAVSRVAALGARRLALSTQGDNVRSQHLYARAGFRRTIEHDYAVRGVVFNRRVLERRDY